MFNYPKKTNMVFKWIPELSVGDQTIDEQHQELFKETSVLLETIIEDNPNSQKVREIVASIDQYIAEHFLYEEAYMRQHAYPGLQEHRVLHDLFRDQFTTLKLRINASQPTTESLIALENFLGQWLVHHIGEEDKKYYRYIEGHEQPHAE